LTAIGPFVVRSVKYEPTALHRIVFCTDPTYPPEESLQGSKPVGSDIGIGGGLARLMGVRAEWRSVGFDGIIAALLAKRCDAILAGMTDTAQPMKQLLLRVPEHPAERSRCAHGCVSANIADNRRRRPNSQPSHELSGRSSTCDTPSAATPQSVSVGKKTAIRNSAASSQMSRITRRTAPGSHHHVRTWLDSVIDLGVPVVTLPTPGSTSRNPLVRASKRFAAPRSNVASAWRSNFCKSTSQLKDPDRN
jgi:hypothetical protein